MMGARSWPRISFSVKFALIVLLNRPAHRRHPAGAGQERGPASGPGRAAKKAGLAGSLITAERRSLGWLRPGDRAAGWAANQDRERRRPIGPGARAGLPGQRWCRRCRRHRLGVLAIADRDAGLLPAQRDRFLALVQRQASIDDLTGHHVGDQGLQGFAEVFVASIHRADLAARYGGEEFVVVMANTGPKEALVVAEKIRAAVAAEPITVEERSQPIRITVSIGGAAILRTQPLPANSCWPPIAPCTPPRRQDATASA